MQNSNVLYATERRPLIVTHQGVVFFSHFVEYQVDPHPDGHSLLVWMAIYAEPNAGEFLERFAASHHPDLEHAIRMADTLLAELGLKKTEPL